MSHCLLSLDLKNTEKPQRDKFYEILESEDWSKVGGVDTTWERRFSNISYEPSISLRVQNVIEDAARRAEIEQVNFVFQVGDHKSRIGELVCEYGIYKLSMDK